MRRFKVNSPRVVAFRNTQQGSLWAVVVGGLLDSTVIAQSADKLNMNELMLARYKVAFTDRRNPDGTYWMYPGDPVKHTEEEIKAGILKYRLRVINHAYDTLQECADEAKAPDRVYCWSRTRKIAKRRATRAAKLFRNVEVIPTILLPKDFNP